MKVIYIAGPYRAKHGGTVWLNIQNASELGKDAARAGLYPLIPHNNYAQWDGLLPDQFFLDATLELMRRCDAVLLVHGWEGSTGTQAEVAEARRRLMPVFEDLDKCVEWAKVSA